MKAGHLLILVFQIIVFTSSAQISGTVFRDYNANGVRNTGASYNEEGVANVTVKAYNSAGTEVGSVVTTPTGVYSFTGLTLPLRIEFIPSLVDDYSGAFGTGSGTNVQFYSTSTSTANFGINYPEHYCHSATPNIVTTCFVNGRPSTGTPQTDVLVQHPYFATGNMTSNTYLGDAGQLGSIWGVAYNRINGDIYTSAFVKRHTALKDNDGNGKEDIGAIYIETTSGTPALWLDLATLPGVDVGLSLMPTIATRALPNSNMGPSYDGAVFPLIGKIGLGDLEISDDNKTLYVVSLYDKKLYSIDIATKTLIGAGIAIPSACTGGGGRPFSVTYHRGKVYVGTVCDAITSQLEPDLKATVYRLDGGTFTNILSFPLNYVKGTAFQDWDNDPTGNTSYGTKWNPWEDSFDAQKAFTAGGVWAMIHPQPILSNIEFDQDEAMVLVFMDRSGHQMGTANYGTSAASNGTTLHNGISAGDILRACISTGSYQLEVNGSCGGTSTAGAGNNQGPATINGAMNGYTGTGGEYYYGDNSLIPYGQLYHHDAAMGGSTFLPGSGKTYAHIVDAYEAWGGGSYLINNTTGNYNNVYGIYPRTVTDVLFGKANGLGDPEVMCNQAPIEIGNRVWTDADSDGIQDAGEAAIQGVTVQLLNSSGTVIGTATTDANGNYYFSNATGTSTTSVIYNISGLQPNAQYTVRIPNVQGGSKQSVLGSKVLTSFNIGGSGQPDVRDSDGILVANNADVTVLTTDIPVSGANNHTFDFGFKTLTCSPATNPGLCNNNILVNSTLENGSFTPTTGTFVGSPYKLISNTDAVLTNWWVNKGYWIDALNSGGGPDGSCKIVWIDPSYGNSICIYPVPDVNLTANQCYTMSVWAAPFDPNNPTAAQTMSFDLVTNSSSEQFIVIDNNGGGTVNTFDDGPYGVVSTTINLAGNTAPLDINGNPFTNSATQTLDWSTLNWQLVTITFHVTQNMPLSPNYSINDATSNGVVFDNPVFGECCQSITCPGPYGGTGAVGDPAQWVVIGDPGNPADGASYSTMVNGSPVVHNSPNQIGYGSVGYEYSIADGFVTIKDYLRFLNDVDPTNTLNFEGDLVNAGLVQYNSGVWSTSPFYCQGISAADLEKVAVTRISLNQKARYANWVATGNVNTGAYSFASTDGNAAITAINNAFTGVRLLTENEYYKAAFWDQTNNTYNLYGTTGLDANGIPLVSGIGVGGVQTNPLGVVYNFTTPDPNVCWPQVQSGQGGRSAYGVSNMAGGFHNSMISASPTFPIINDVLRPDNLASTEVGQRSSYRNDFTFANAFYPSPGFQIAKTGNACACEVIVMTAEPTSCIPGDNSYALNGMITFPTAPTTGTLTVTVPGGVPTVFSPPFMSPTNYTISLGLISDGASHTVTATFSDVAGCTGSIDYVAPVSCAVSCTLGVTCNPSPQTTCAPFNGSATTSVTGGQGNIAYQWSSGETTSSITGKQAGTYTVTVTDDILPACVAVCQAIITNNTVIPTVTCSKTDNTNCATPNGTATATATGVTYAWSNGGTTATITGLSNATYTVTVTDLSTGCTNTCEAIVGSTTTLPSASCSKTDNSNCLNPNGTATVTTDANQILWSNTATTATITGLSEGTYTVTVTNTATGCTNSCQVIVANNTTNPVVTCSKTDNTNCATPNGTANVSTNATNPTYVWSTTPAQTTSSISNLAAGTYTVTVTNQSTGCTNTCSAQVLSTTAPPSATCSKTDNTNCTTPNGTASVTTNATNPTYVWSTTPAQTTSSISNLAAGTYTVTVTDQSTGCTNTCSAQVLSTTAPPSATCSKTNNTNCATPNGTASVTTNATNPTYVWSTTPAQTTSSISNLAAGTYTVTVTDQSTGCTNTCSAQVLSTTAPPSATCSKTDNTNCTTPNGTASVITDASNPTYVWSTTPAQTTSSISNLAAGTYTVTVTDQSTGCTNTCSAQVLSTTAPPSATCSKTDNTNCTTPNGTASVTTNATNPTYVWSTTPAQTTSSISNLTAGTYTVTVTNQSTGCTNTCEAIIVNATVNPTCSITANSQPSCANLTGGSITVTPSPAGTYSYAWSDSGPNTATRTGLTGGTYTVTVTNTTTNCTGVCNITLTTPTNCCNINAVTIQNVVCNDNSTPGLITDNRLVINALVTNTNASLTSYNATVSGGTTITPNTNIPYGAVQFTLGPGTAGGGATFTVTLTDTATPGCTQTFTVTDPGNCPPAVNCPTPKCGTATIQVNGN